MKSFKNSELRFFICWFTLIASSLSTLAIEDLPQNPKKPNIIFILVDDLGIKDLSCLGSSFYETPNIDKIAKEGTIFTQGYACSAVCSPSRASIMTGKFTARHGITDWIGAKSGIAWRSEKRFSKLLPAGYVENLPKTEQTIAEVLQANGYKTFFAGKWHLGNKGDYPEDHGFNINKGGWESGSPKGGYFSPWENPSLPNQRNGEDLSMRLAKETSAFIQQERDSPFFAFLSFYAVHSPIETTQEKWKKYKDKAEKNGILPHGYTMEHELPIRQVQDNPIYGGLVESMDDAVGEVLNTIKKLNLEQQTIIVFTSDNGGVASGDAFSTTNLPFRGGKGYQWEGGIREPYFIKIPWLPQIKELNYPVTGADFFPTILDFAGIPLMPKQHIDGISLKPLFDGKELKTRDLFWHYPHYGNQGGQPNSIIRSGNLKLIHYWEDGHYELYNLANDPYEQKDLASKEPQKASKLNTKLLTWLKSVNAQYPVQDPEFNADLANKKLKNNSEILMPKLEKERLHFLSSDYQPNKDWWKSKTTKD
ncbi:sulfatase (plasmid) [Emticicia oligotrophica DSM 17448]|uniref:Sulfatase n=1 Tax=Emticicia oligotrophica (strain DSM 17448 / CIP 109782 / MTCC 6937 / GPTSA100-15) TaxID=929562 RepID=A0ABN4ASU8_EMTOG|nr:sulfatase [Emticicia oligotrophica]AFK05734.1 sulfatase [Emticicia oligotrophica DSM 17448]